MSFISLIHTCLDCLPASCVLCGLSTHHTHQLCTACFNDCQVYSESLLGACSNTFALFPYREPFMRMIVNLKFNHKLIYAKTFGTLLAYNAPKWYSQQRLPDRIIPVPLHEERLKERGFNQALEIARYPARLLRIPLDYQAVTRIKPTLAQSSLSKASRQRNMQGAFACHTRFDGQTLAILDDVVTTGQTVGELSRVLLRKGAARVDVWCCARA